MAFFPKKWQWHWDLHEAGQVTLPLAVQWKQIGSFGTNNGPQCELHAGGDSGD